MVFFLEKLKLWKYQGAATKQTEAYIRTCDNCIEIVKSIPPVRIEGLKNT